MIPMPGGNRTGMPGLRSNRAPTLNCCNGLRKVAAIKSNDRREVEAGTRCGDQQEDQQGAQDALSRTHCDLLKQALKQDLVGAAGFEPATPRL